MASCRSNAYIETFKKYVSRENGNHLRHTSVQRDYMQTFHKWFFLEGYILHLSHCISKAANTVFLSERRVLWYLLMLVRFARMNIHANWFTGVFLSTSNFVRLLSLRTVLCTQTRLCEQHFYDYLETQVILCVCVCVSNGKIWMLVSALSVGLYLMVTVQHCWVLMITVRQCWVPMVTVRQCWVPMVTVQQCWVPTISVR